MFTHDEAQALIGATARDRDGQKVGHVTAVYEDRVTGAPEWLTVTTGLFGSKETFVPIALARIRGHGGEVELAATKDTITSAPRISPDGHLSPYKEEQVFLHYGLSYTSPPFPTAEPVPPADDAMTRSEEQMHVGTETAETGRVRLRKVIVTEHVTQTIPVSHEEVRVEREPITDANVDEAMAGEPLSTAEHEVILHAERPVVTKETVPVERVRLSKDTVAGETTVTGEVRHEQIDTETDGERPVRPERL